MALATPKVAPNRPENLPRSRGANRSAMMAKAVVNRAPPPRPWMARKTISWVMPPPRIGMSPNSPDRPASQEPNRNRAMPAISTALRPKMSPSLPQIGIITVEDSR